MEIIKIDNESLKETQTKIILKKDLDEELEIINLEIESAMNEKKKIEDRLKLFK